MPTSPRKRRKVCQKKLRVGNIDALENVQPRDTIGKERIVVLWATRHLKSLDLVMVEAKNGLSDKRVLTTEFPNCPIENGRSRLGSQDRSGIPEDRLKQNSKAKLICMFLNQCNLI